MESATIATGWLKAKSESWCSRGETGGHHAFLRYVAGLRHQNCRRRDESMTAFEKSVMAALVATCLVVFGPAQAQQPPTGPAPSVSVAPQSSADSDATGMSAVAGESATDLAKKLQNPPATESACRSRATPTSMSGLIKARRTSSTSSRSYRFISARTGT
jgi:hypothetical protein